jgi:hypothetical protein
LTYQTRLDRWLQRNSQHDSAIIKAERSAKFIAMNGIVEGVWLDPFNNYIATVFSKATYQRPSSAS